MKSFTILFCIIGNIVFGMELFGQDISFGYDESGNWVSRISVIKELESELNDSSSIYRYLNDTVNQYNNDLSISISPNPTTNSVNIQCLNLKKHCLIEMYVFSVKGELLQKTQLNSAENTFDLLNYPKGIYFFKIQIGEKITSWKIIKK